MGCPRSGTTLLQLMLQAHPRIALPPGTRFVLPACRQRLGLGDLRERANRSLGRVFKLPPPANAGRCPQPHDAWHAPPSSRT
ncbi:sulfotransferase, partial [Streptomyces sp. NPDC050095]|uniref:sulfotransferase n=1 Tax=unclassified Streptomyces TaxID=2593676 RepID=UPI0034233206